MAECQELVIEIREERDPIGWILMCWEWDWKATHQEPTPRLRYSVLCGIELMSGGYMECSDRVHTDPSEWNLLRKVHHNAWNILHDPVAGLYFVH
jgi:hypothetical protein